MKKTFSLVYGAVAYLLFLGSFLYLAAFSMNLAPHSVSGKASLPPAIAVLIDTALIALFGVQHSVMARPAFKRRWTEVVPPHLERSTYVLIASCMLAAVIFGWQPIEGELWNVTGAPRIALYAISAIGWLMVPGFSFLTDHFHLFGLRQVFDYATGKPVSQPVFRERGAYKSIRHPMMLGFLIAFWATPHMTLGHSFLATLMTAFIMAGIYFEERTLAAEHGAAYRDYQARVPKLIPGLGTPNKQPTVARGATARVR